MSKDLLGNLINVNNFYICKCKKLKYLWSTSIGNLVHLNLHISSGLCNLLKVDPYYFRAILNLHPSKYRFFALNFLAILTQQLHSYSVRRCCTFQKNRTENFGKESKLEISLFEFSELSANRFRNPKINKTDKN